jgi:hypothetical protein
MSRRLIDAALLLLLAAVLVLHWRAASTLLGGSLEGDQPKHFTSGVLMYDYLREGLGSNPVHFAENFEVRYPLVAIGQWPPMYYAIQGVYYFLTGPSIHSAQVLSALMALVLAGLIVFSVVATAGKRIAMIASLVFLATPLIQIAAWQIMSDLLTGLFIFGAIVSFAKLLDDPGNWKAALTFALCGVAAILSKGSAWALGPFVILAPVLSRRARFFLSRWSWGAGLGLVVVCSPFFLLSKRAGIGYHANLAHMFNGSVGIGHRAEMFHALLSFAPVPLLVVGALGLVIALDERWRRRDKSSATTLALVSAAWVLSQMLFLFMLPLTWEPRVLIPALAPLAVLAAQSMVWLQRDLRGRQRLASAAPVLLGALLVASSWAAILPRAVGYREAAAAMPYPPDGALILISAGDDSCEADLIAERLSHGRSHRDVILRGSHVLADVNTNDDHETPFFHSAEEVRSYLLSLPVRFVVLCGPPFTFGYQSFVEAAVTGDPKDFHLVATVPVEEFPGVPAGKVRIYENPAGRDHHPDAVRTRLGSYAGGRVLEYQWR